MKNKQKMPLKHKYKIAIYQDGILPVILTINPKRYKKKEKEFDWSKYDIGYIRKGERLGIGLIKVKTKYIGDKS